MPERIRRASSPVHGRSKQLRHDQTPAEQILWQRLRARKLGAKFRRQHAVGRFIADFCCLEHRLIIEVDGSIHNNQRARDAERTAWLEAAGYRLLRFSNEQVLHETEQVVVCIQRALTPGPSPASGRREEVTLGRGHGAEWERSDGGIP